jgi:hypothetical protein
VLEKQTRLDIFETICIQRIIDYKWRAYSKNSVNRQFYMMLALSITFFVSIFLEQDIIEDDLIEETLKIAGFNFKD